jgi:hypothetical protein
MVRRGRLTGVSHTYHAAHAARGLAVGAVIAALVGVQLVAPAFALADAAPGAPVISASTAPPAGTHSCPTPPGGSPSTLAMGTVCSFTLSPNPADSSVPTEYEVSYPFNLDPPMIMYDGATLLRS